MLHNRTRRSGSIPRRLLAERRPYLVPLYWLLRSSDLAREGMENSGSFRFADHIYTGSVSGRGALGRGVDRVLLSLASSRSFRNRFIHARDAILELIRSSPRKTLHILSVPSGIARELIEVALTLRHEDSDRLDHVTFHCLDLDDAPLEETCAAIQRERLANFVFHRGDAFDAHAYPSSLDVITSTGFVEFLSDADAAKFYRHCIHCLRPGGLLVTSATIQHRLSAYLMEHLAELTAHYRDETDVARIFDSIPMADVSWRRDEVGYQILILARKKAEPDTEPYKGAPHGL